jgi:hypothetical protein
MADTVRSTAMREITPHHSRTKLTQPGGSLRTTYLAAAIAAFALTSACEKTGEGEYQVEKPVIGTETDTVETPSVETGTVKDTISVPDVDVNTEKKEVEVPDVDVQTPSERE